MASHQKKFDHISAIQTVTNEGANMAEHSFTHLARDFVNFCQSVAIDLNIFPEDVYEFTTRLAIESKRQELPLKTQAVKFRKKAYSFFEIPFAVIMKDIWGVLKPEIDKREQEMEAARKAAKRNRKETGLPQSNLQKRKPAKALSEKAGMVSNVFSESKVPSTHPLNRSYPNLAPPETTEAIMGLRQALLENPREHYEKLINSV